MEDKEMFEKLLEKVSKDNNTEILYILVTTLITADNNLTQEELDANCKKIDLLIDALKNYDDLQNLREKLIDYRKNITL